MWTGAATQARNTPCRSRTTSSRPSSRPRRAEAMLRIGVVGYGTGGRHFHTPFIAAAKNCELAGIVARAEKTVAAVKVDWPDTPVFDSLTEMIEAQICD